MSAVRLAEDSCKVFGKGEHVNIDSGSAALDTAPHTREEESCQQSYMVTVAVTSMPGPSSKCSTCSQRHTSRHNNNRNL